MKIKSKFKIEIIRAPFHNNELGKMEPKTFFIFRLKRYIFFSEDRELVHLFNGKLFHCFAESSHPL